MKLILINCYLYNDTGKEKYYYCGRAGQIRCSGCGGHSASIYNVPHENLISDSDMTSGIHQLIIHFNNKFKDIIEMALLVAICPHENICCKVNLVRYTA